MESKPRCFNSVWLYAAGLLCGAVLGSAGTVWIFEHSARARAPLCVANTQAATQALAAADSWKAVAEKCQARAEAVAVLYEPGDPLPNMFSIPLFHGAMRVNLSGLGAAPAGVAPRWIVSGSISPQVVGPAGSRAFVTIDKEGYIGTPQTPAEYRLPTSAK